MALSSHTKEPPEFSGRFIHADVVGEIKKRWIGVKAC
jgi:hypothetical protein